MTTTRVNRLMVIVLIGAALSFSVCKSDRAVGNNIAAGGEPAEEGLYDRTGVHKLAVVLVDFLDVTNPETAAEALEAIYGGNGSLNAFFTRQSYRRFSLRGHLKEHGDVFGPVTIDFASQPCNWEQWAPAAREAIATEGFDADEYDFMFYIFAGECTGFGRSHWTPPSMVVGNLSKLGLRHEGGHAFGWNHASRYECREGEERVTLSRDCVHVEYGDVFSLMGPGTIGPVNQYLRGQFNWLIPSNTRTLAEDGTATVALINEHTDDVQVVRIPRILGDNRVEEFLYVESRESIDGVLLRLAPRYDVRARPHLLDATPGTETFEDAALTVGKTFSDPEVGMSVTVLDQSADGLATIDVTVGTPLTCGRKPPTAEFVTTAPTSEAGGSVELPFQITNNDVDCPITLFLGSIDVPDGWKVPGPPEGKPIPADDRRVESTLFPGDEATRVMTVAVPEGTSPGEYCLSVTLKSEAGHDVTFSTTIEVIG